MSSRPYRLLRWRYNGGDQSPEKVPISHACYAHAMTCLEGGGRRSLFELHVGEVIECINQDSTRVLGWYRRNAKGQVTFWRNTNV